MTLLNALFAEEQAGNNADKHVMSRPRLHQENNVVFDHKSWTPHIAFFDTHDMPTRFVNFIKSKQNYLLLVIFGKSSSIMFCTNRRARWINLVWNTIIIRTERTGNSKTCFQTCCDQLLDSSQEQKKSMSSCRVLLPFYKHFTEKSLKKNCCNIKQKYGSECTHSGDVQWIGKPCDFSEFMVIDKNDSVQSS